MPKNNKYTIDLEDLYTVRLVVMLEDEPQSNRYHQVILNPEQFRMLSLFLDGMFRNHQGPGSIIPTGDRPMILRDEIRDYYETPTHR